MTFSPVSRKFLAMLNKMLYSVGIYFDTKFLLAVDGFHVGCHPKGLVREDYRNRHHSLSINVMMACGYDRWIHAIRSREAFSNNVDILKVRPKH